MIGDVQRRRAGVWAIAACALSACFDEPDYSGRRCSLLEPCPLGYVCGTDERCHSNAAPNEDAGEDATLDAEPALDAASMLDAEAPIDADTRDAEPGDAGTIDAPARDAGFADAAPRDAMTPDAMTPDAMTIDAGPPDAGPMPIELIIPIAVGTHDALQDPDGSMLITYGWMSLYSDMHWGALRFEVPPLPAGASIEDAYLEVYVDSLNEDDPAIRIHIEPTNAPALFSSTAFDISNRTRSTTFVEWSATGIGDGWKRSPSVRALVNEIYTATQPATAFAILFILDAQPGATMFELRQRDHTMGAANAAKLILTYRP
jgi:hypothetical protein